MPNEGDRGVDGPEGSDRSHNLTSFKDLRRSHESRSAPWRSHHVWQELQQLLHLAAPACLQLCAQQGLVVSFDRS